MSDDPTKRTQKFQKTPSRAVRKPKVRDPKTRKRDFSQIALSVVEQATGGKLTRKTR